jgi:hypothetical protein
MICGLLGTSSTRLVVNGVPGGLISNRRGLRQGDSLSPSSSTLLWTSSTS